MVSNGTILKVKKSIESYFNFLCVVYFTIGIIISYLFMPLDTKLSFNSISV